MQPSLEPADAINRAPIMPSVRKFNEKSVIQGYFNPKIIIFALETVLVNKYERIP